MKVVLCVVALFGIALAAAGGRIIGGENAQRGIFTSMVSVQYCRLGFCEHSCGGTILAQSWIVTAASCITEVPNLGSLFVLAGANTLYNINNNGRQYVQINQRITHPDYVRGVNDNDIALLGLSSPLILNNLVQVARLPAAGSVPQGTGVLVGWGSVGGTILPQMPNILQWVTIPIITIDECNAALTDLLGGGAQPLDSETNICTGPLDAPISACNGDSGGPLFIDGDEVVGVVSWNFNPCGTVGAPTVYVNVAAYIDWIESYISP